MKKILSIFVAVVILILGAIITLVYMTSEPKEPSPDIDSASYVELGGYYSKDKNHAYTNAYDEDKLEIIEGADLVSFTSIGDLYAKDKNHVYYYYGFKDRVKIVNGADPASFNHLRHDYAKDKNLVFYNGKIFEGADSPSFSASNVYAKDKNHVYDHGQIVEGADPASFVELKPTGKYINPLVMYAKNKNQVYYYNTDTGTKVIKSADPNSIVFLGLEYAKDKNHVYFEGNILAGADPATFKLPIPEPVE